MTSSALNTGEGSRQVALVTCSDFAALYADDQLLLPELTALGIHGTPACWDDDSVQWNSFDAILIRSPWDYFKRIKAFAVWLEARVGGPVPLINSADILRWNFDKRYLQTLEQAGVAIVPTLFVEQGTPADVAALARAKGWQEIVVKPSVSGGAYRTHRLRVEDVATASADIALTLSECSLMIQPFMPEILRDGELSFLFFNGQFSHAVRKR